MVHLSDRHRLHRVANHVADILEFEPSWFAEFGSGVSMALWSLGAFLTDDIVIRGGSWVLPVIGIILGPLRWVLLWQRWYLARVMAATASALFWGWIAAAAAARYGMIPRASGPESWMLMDCLTMARFSLPCFRDLMVELRGRRNGN